MKTHGRGQQAARSHTPWGPWGTHSEAPHRAVRPFCTLVGMWTLLHTLDLEPETPEGETGQSSLSHCRKTRPGVGGGRGCFSRGVRTYLSPESLGSHPGHCPHPSQQPVQDRKLLTPPPPTPRPPEFAEKASEAAGLGIRSPRYRPPAVRAGPSALRCPPRGPVCWEPAGQAWAPPPVPAPPRQGWASGLLLSDGVTGIGGPAREALSTDGGPRAGACSLFLSLPSEMAAPLLCNSQATQTGTANQSTRSRLEATEVGFKHRVSVTPQSARPKLEEAAASPPPASGSRQNVPPASNGTDGLPVTPAGRSRAGGCHGRPSTRCAPGSTRPEAGLWQTRGHAGGGPVKTRGICCQRTSTHLGGSQAHPPAPRGPQARPPPALTATAFSDCTMIQWISSNSLPVTSLPRVLSKYSRRLLTVHLPPWMWL